MWDFFKGSKWTTTSQSSPSFSSLFIIIIFKDVSISLSEEEKERQRSYIFCALLSKFPQQLGQDWAEARSLECHPGLSRGWQRIKGPLVGSWTGSTTAEMRTGTWMWASQMTAQFSTLQCSFSCLSLAFRENMNTQTCQTLQHDSLIWWFWAHSPLLLTGIPSYLFPSTFLHNSLSFLLSALGIHLLRPHLQLPCPVISGIMRNPNKSWVWSWDLNSLTLPRVRSPWAGCVPLMQVGRWLNSPAASLMLRLHKSSHTLPQCAHFHPLAIAENETPAGPNVTVSRVSMMTFS